LSSFVKRWVGPIIKVILTVAFFYVIRNQILAKGEVLTLINQFFENIEVSQLFLLLVVLLLMLLNWFLESMKWRAMVNVYYSINIQNSIKAVLMGLSIGIATPNRIGEFAGRLLMVPRNKNLLSIKANVLNSIAQNISTIFIGALCLYLNQSLIASIKINPLYFIYSLVGILVLFMILYFWLGSLLNLPWISYLENKFSRWGNLSSYPFSIPLKLKVLGFSMFRFLIYCFQFYLILRVAGVQILPMELFSAVAFIFMIQSFFPLPPMFNVMARGGIAILVLGLYNLNEISILASTFLLWIINVLIPALIGLLLLIRSRISDSI